MKKKWNVMTVKLGVSIVQRSLFTCAEGAGREAIAPMWSLAVWNDEHKVLIDTGYHDVDWVTKNCERSEQTESEQIINALRSGPGWAPDDIDTVINTHLHYDHCGNNRLFTRAKFHVSSTEWEFAFNPLESQKRIYLESLFDYSAVNYFNWKFFDGETEILPGIMVFPTPGHTPGHHSVLIDTDDGPLCFAGDAVNLLINITQNIPPQISYSNVQVFQTIKEIKRRANRIIPGHEILIKNFETRDFPLIR
jgi:glyoxylase-like metal-dependent hydrolase (beta-lactamase superfamily II)